jgi:hypothetical protein
LRRTARDHAVRDELRQPEVDGHADPAVAGRHGVTLEALASGDLDAVDPTRYYDIPPAGPSVGNPRFDL